MIHRDSGNMDEIGKWVLAVFTFLVGWIGGMVLGIFLAYSKENYFLLSLVSFWWIELLFILPKENLIRKSKKLEKIFLNRLHTTRLIASILMIITIILSIKFFVAFIGFVIVSILYLQVKQAIKEDEESLY